MGPPLTETLEQGNRVGAGPVREVYRRIYKVMGWGKLEGDLWEIKLGKIYNS